MKTCYGKNVEDLTADEHKLLKMDMALMMMTIMGVLGGPDHDTNQKQIIRTMFAGKLLGIPSVSTQEEFDDLCGKVEESVYGVAKFINMMMPDEEPAEEETAETPKG